MSEMEEAFNTLKKQAETLAKLAVEENLKLVMMDRSDEKARKAQIKLVESVQADVVRTTETLEKLMELQAGLEVKTTSPNLIKINFNATRRKWIVLYRKVISNSQNSVRSILLQHCTQPRLRRIREDRKRHPVFRERQHRCFYQNPP